MPITCDAYPSRCEAPILSSIEPLVIGSRLCTEQELQTGQCARPAR
jgi:hypothetical protein